MPAWVEQAWAEYSRRFPRGLNLVLREIPLARRARNADVAALRAAEGEALLGAVPSGHRIIALDEGGRQWSTIELAPDGEISLRKRRTIQHASTRTYYRGRHLVELQVAGSVVAATSFVVRL